MDGDVIVVLIVLAALGSGLIAGVFFAFSSFVMRGLAIIPPTHGLAAMQAINVTVINPAFLGVFLGTGVLSVILTVVAVVNFGDRDAPLVLTGSLLYLIGSIGVTMACNVPRNNWIAALDAADSASATAWYRYIHEWTRWNTVRTIASLAAMLAFVMSLIA
jgi:uncharacterized membrane protein